MRRAEGPGRGLEPAGGRLAIGELTVDPARHEARVGGTMPGPDADRVPAARDPPAGRWRRRPPSPPGPGRLAGRRRPGPALAQTSSSPAAGEARRTRRPVHRGRPRRRLPPRTRSLTTHPPVSRVFAARLNLYDAGVPRPHQRLPGSIAQRIPGLATRGGPSREPSHDLCAHRRPARRAGPPRSSSP